ncbi:Low-specificity L-threonine aldolase [hydrothermal vent metagenome]|uniref:Low-specificity L-threonine aldolase n=1 Tax=hydrothermal vent metagenome TaxID=652676 RepID=A0A3B0VWI2_9ZZZZ
MDRIDFRSDTVSWPTPAMRKAMANAPVGDDVYGEDPTVNRLEAMAAEMTGKEAGLFVASGTMGNLAAILSHAQRGDCAIVGEDSHTVQAEAGGMAVLGSIVPNPLPTDQYGRMDLAALEAAVYPDDSHYPIPRLILVENSYGAKGGYPIAPDYFEKVRQIADRHKLIVHMDGARLFNAAVALNLDAQEMTQHVDSVTFCLSKGLCAPVGSLLCGSAEFIQKAHRARKLLGGGMRQAGILAAAGIVALSEMVERLADDHAHAKQLADGLAQIPDIEIEPERVKTNILFFDLAESASVTPETLVQRLREEANIWLSGGYGRSFRAVTHYWIQETDVSLFLKTMRAILQVEEK